MPSPQRNKILYIPSWYPNRIERASGNFIKRLIEANAAFDDVAVLYAIPVEKPAKELEIVISRDKGFPEVLVYYQKVKGSGILSTIKKARQRFKAYEKGFEAVKKNWGIPKLVHVQAAFPAIFFANRLYKKQNIPYLLTEHGLSTYANSSSDATFRMLKQAINGAKKVLTVSEYLANAMRKSGIRNNFEVVPNVVPLPEVLPDTKNTNSKKRILHISTLADVKNPEGILRVIKNVSAQRNDFELVIVGEKEHELNEVMEYSKSLGLTNDVVKFNSYIEDTNKIAELLLSSNFMLMFSQYETFSIVLAESLWAGRPVITSRCGGPQEFINTDFGLMVEPGDEKALENAIINMLNTSSGYDTAKMREFAHNHFSPNVIGKKLHGIHSSIIAQG
jgi:glycosyltransferase involved in cell wall biosynthesis